MTPYAHITFKFSDGTERTEGVYSHARPTAMIQANDTSISYRRKQLDSILFEPYLSHSGRWELLVDYDQQGDHTQLVDIPGNGEQECRLIHDPADENSPKWDCDQATGGVTGWTLVVRTKKKVRAPDPLDSIQAATHAAEHAAKAAEAAAKAALAAIEAIRAQQDA